LAMSTFTIEDNAKLLKERECVLFPFEINQEWQRIVNILNRKIPNVDSLEKAIASIAFPEEINKDRIPKFSLLSDYWESKAKTSKLQMTSLFFFDNLLPFIVKLALDLPNVFRDCRVLVLRHKKEPTEESVQLSRAQVASILANAFFGVFERVISITEAVELEFLRLSFLHLYTGNRNHCMAAFECILHYFERLYRQMPQGQLIIRRRTLVDPPNWASSERTLSKVLLCQGRLETSSAALHVDFANMYIGGGVLHGGCVQEEILFLIKTECLVSRLICTKMEDEDVIFIENAIQFSDYVGYGTSFEFSGDHSDNRPCSIVAMDAIRCRVGGGQQYEREFFLRDLNKAYCAFRPGPGHSVNNENRTVSTGHWGCGGLHVH